MRLMEEKIQCCGRILPGDILKVDGFLNHQIDVNLLNRAGEELYRLFGEEKVTKILTVEASGIAVACLAAIHFCVPVLFAKKTASKNVGQDRYTSMAKSYTRGGVFEVSVSKEYLHREDRVLIVDDFLATGSAMEALADLVAQAGAALVGCGVMVEKEYQNGGNDLRRRGIRVESLAKIASMSEKDGIVFC